MTSRYVAAYASMSAIVCAHGFCRKIMSPTPRRAMIPCDSGEIDDAYVRPRSGSSGAGRIATGGWWSSSTSYAIVPVSNASRSPRLAHRRAGASLPCSRGTPRTRRARGRAQRRAPAGRPTRGRGPTLPPQRAPGSAKAARRPSNPASRATSGRDPRQELQRVRRQRVVGEVVLDRPHRVEAEAFGAVGQRELGPPRRHPGVRDRDSGRTCRIPRAWG